MFFFAMWIPYDLDSINVFRQVLCTAAQMHLYKFTIHEFAVDATVTAAEEMLTGVQNCWIFKLFFDSYPVGEFVQRITVSAKPFKGDNLTPFFVVNRYVATVKFFAPELCGV